MHGNVWFFTDELGIVLKHMQIKYPGIVSTDYNGREWGQHPVIIGQTPVYVCIISFRPDRNGSADGPNRIPSESGTLLPRLQPWYAKIALGSSVSTTPHPAKPSRPNRRTSFRQPVSLGRSNHRTPWFYWLLLVSRGWETCDNITIRNPGIKLLYKHIISSARLVRARLRPSKGLFMGEVYWLNSYNLRIN